MSSITIMALLTKDPAKKKKSHLLLLSWMLFSLAIISLSVSIILSCKKQQNDDITYYDPGPGSGPVTTTHGSMLTTSTNMNVNNNNNMNNTNMNMNMNTNTNTIVYGHLHVAKTGGTNPNGRMAAKYDNVCGNKGYSFNSYQINAEKFRLKFNNESSTSSESGTTGTGTGTVGRNKQRKEQQKQAIELKGTQYSAMKEIGFENCDFISSENSWQFWTNDVVKNLEFETRNMTLELHVPCRDPIDHLLSTCNHGNRTFRCPDLDLIRDGDGEGGEEEATAAIEQEIKNCLWHGGPMDKQKVVDQRKRRRRSRFSIKLNNKNNNNTKSSKEQQQQQQQRHSNNKNNNNIHINLKCFKSFPLENYIDYMGNFLRPRKIESPYFKWDTNAERVASNECLLTQDQDYINTVRRLMIFKLDDMGYYRFCQDCLGSNDELPL